MKSNQYFTDALPIKVLYKAVIYNNKIVILELFRIGLVTGPMSAALARGFRIGPTRLVISYWSYFRSDVSCIGPVSGHRTNTANLRHVIMSIRNHMQ